MVAWILINFIKIILCVYLLQNYAYWAAYCVLDIQEVWERFKKTGYLTDFRQETLFFISSHLLLIGLTIIYAITH